MRHDDDTTARATDHRSPLVSADWLTRHLDDPGIGVVEVDVSPVAHDDGHIPGAVLWNIYTEIKNGDYDFVGRPAFEELVRRSGIDAASTVVFYGYAPAFGYWLLRLFGHDDVRILDLDRATWRAEGRPWTNTPSVPQRSGYDLGPEVPGLRASLTDTIDAINRPTDCVIDVRGRLEFEGERFWPSGGMEPGGRAGHVPGALNLPAEDYLDERGAFRPTEELRRQFEPLDGTEIERLITYCTIGARASTAWFVLSELLGHNRVRVYDGSWAEWGRTPTAPVES